MSSSTEKGQALVEFAIILPVLLFIMAGIVSFGQWYAMKNRMVMLSQYGAGLKKAGFSVEEIRQRIRQDVPGDLWRTVTTDVEAVPLAAFFPSISQRITVRVEAKPTALLRGIVGFRSMKEHVLLTIDSWKFGIPGE